MGFLAQTADLLHYRHREISKLQKTDLKTVRYTNGNFEHQMVPVRFLFGAFGNPVTLTTTNNDPGGHDLAAEIETITKATGRSDLIFTAHWLEGPGCDWNEHLRRDVVSGPPGPIARQ